MARYFLIVSLFCVFGTVMVFGRAVVSPKKQAELMVSPVSDSLVSFYNASLITQTKIMFLMSRVY